MQISNTFARLFAAVMCVTAAFACHPAAPDQGATTLELQIPRIALDSKAGSQFIYVTADCDWTLTLSDEWARTDQSSGSGTVKGILFSWDKNEGEQRECKLVLAGGGKVDSLTVVQLAASSGGSDVPSVLTQDPVPAWLELPAMDDKDGCCYLNHHMTIGDKKLRNYSFYMDPEALVARWVAYPLNKSLISSGSRTNQWGLDPKVPRDCQAVLYSGFRGAYDRGHQLPSADRLVYEANVSTFYGTNMTPQKGELNQKAWASLENMVRTWSNSFDTLYVVTGCDLRGSSETALDNDGKEVKVPTGYYKALLGYKKAGGVGICSTTAGYTGIAFYFEHRAYPDDTASVLAQSMTIDQLETKMGIDFYPGLVDKIGEAYASKVESTSDSWWTK